MLRHQLNTEKSPSKQRKPKRLERVEGVVVLDETKVKNGMWGRAYTKLPISSIFYTTFLLLFAPIIVYYFFISCNSYGCELNRPIMDLISGRRSLTEFVKTEFPIPTWRAFTVFTVWELFQLVLYLYMPGPIGYGQETPAGQKLAYNVNGLRVWVVTHLTFFACTWIGLFPATIVYDNWGPLLTIANIFGYILAISCFLKAKFYPTHREDVKWSGNLCYDFFMGAEFNPRIGTFDFKLFFNGRPGIIGWNIINISFCAAQLRNHGTITNSMLLVVILHLAYIIDFFWNEDWYLRTIDISHDHFGWYLAWGDSVWLPWMYTLQGFYLTVVPYDISNLEFGIVLILGITGYAIFRVANNQRNYFRLANGKCDIWGKPARYIEATFTTANGTEHKALLLTCGFWGLARHFNYLGDLLLSFAYCAACGWNHALPYFYIIQMTVLLVMRAERDNGRCLNKYGPKWVEYCKQVPYKIVPHLY